MKLPGPIQAAADRAASMTNKDYANEQDPQEDPIEEAQVAAEEQPPVEAAPVEPQQPTSDWEKRFKSYKSATDNTIHDLRTRLATLTAEVAELTVENDKLRDAAQKSAPVSIPSGVLSEDDLDALGPENAERLAKLVRAAQTEHQKKLDAELKALHAKIRDQEVAKQAETVKSEGQSFWGKVESKLRDRGVDLYEVDNSPEFAQWLQTVDPESGRPRSALGKSARDIRDVTRMVDFYLEFSGGRQRVASRADAAVPVGASAPGISGSDKKVWTSKEYQEQVMKLTRGGPITGERSSRLKQLHESYMTALKEGRVRR